MSVNLRQFYKAKKIMNPGHQTCRSGTYSPHRVCIIISGVYVVKPVRVLSAAVLIFLFCFGFGVAIFE